MFQLRLLKYMLNFILIIEINHITNVKYLGNFQGQAFGKNLHYGRLTFGRKNKSIKGSRSITFTHNVDYDTIKIIGEGNVI